MSGPTLRTAMLNVIDQVTNVLLPTVLDQVTTQVTVVTRTWLGGQVGADGGYTDANLVLPQKYPVEMLKTREIASSNGLYEMGDIRVSAIVPNDPVNPGVGFSPAQLAPYVTAQGVEVFYALANSVVGDKSPHQGEYTRVELDTTNPYEYLLVLRRRATTPMTTGPFTAP